MPHRIPSAPHDCPAPRYQYDPDAPRFAKLLDRHVGFPAASVGITDSGSFAVVVDPSTPAHLVGHSLDYADRLAELTLAIPEQRDHRADRPTGLAIPEQRNRRADRRQTGRHRAAPEQHLRAGQLAMLLLFMAYTMISCAGPGWGVGVGF